MRRILLFWVICITLFHGVGICSASAKFMQNYNYFSSSEVFHIDVYEEKLNTVTSYISFHSGEKIELSDDVLEKRVTVRCEARWQDILQQICALNNLVIVSQKNGWKIETPETEK